MTNYIAIHLIVVALAEADRYLKIMQQSECKWLSTQSSIAYTGILCCPFPVFIIGSQRLILRTFNCVRKMYEYSI